MMDLKNKMNLVGLLVAGIIYTVLDMYVAGTIGGLATGYVAWIVWIIYFAIVYLIVTAIFEAVAKKK